MTFCKSLLHGVTHDEYPVRMAVMLAKTYEAFKDAGASDEKAREAVEEIAAFENRLASIENRFIRVEVLLTVEPGRCGQLGR